MRAVAMPEGPGGLRGRTYEVPGWYRWSDRAKLRWLRRMGKDYGQDPRMREFTINTVLRPTGVQQRDYPAQAAAILRWVQDNVAYYNEPGEIVHSPWQVLRLRYADCDDSSLLIAAMAESIKLPWRFALAGDQKTAAGRRKVRYLDGEGGPTWGVNYSHIYIQLGWPPFQPRHWASAEPTIRGAPLGYDVVQHGLRLWGERPVQGPLPGGMSEPDRRSRGPGGPSAMGRWGQAPAVEVADGTTVDPLATDAAVGHPPEGKLAALWARIDWDDVLLGVVQGAVTALAINWLLGRKK